MPRGSERNLLIALDEAWSINSVWHGNWIFCMGRSAWGFQNIFKEKFIKPKFQEQILKCSGNYLNVRKLFSVRKKAAHLRKNKSKFDGA